MAAAAGLVLDPWQAYVLEQSLGETKDGRWAAFEVALMVPRQNGKGSVLEARELAGLFLFGEQLILHSAHEFKTAQEAFRRVLALVDNNDHFRRRVSKVRTSHGEEGIELVGGARLRFVARSTGSGRGFSGDVVILDEAYNLSADSMAALLPTLSARPNPQLWYTSSAGMESSEQLARLRKRGADGGSEGLAYFEYSAEPDADLDDRGAWLEANPALGIRIPVEFVARERAALPDAEFARERLGVWAHGAVSAVIPTEMWSTLRDDTSQVLDPVAFAVDVAPDRASAAIGVAGRRVDGLTHLEVVDHRAGTDWVAGRVAALVAGHGTCAVVLDPGSPAGGLLSDLREAGVDPVLIGSRDVTAACGAFYDAAVSRSARYPSSPALDAAVAGATRRTVGDGAWAWSRKSSAVDICPLVAVTYAAHGFAVHGVPANYDVMASVW